MFQRLTYKALNIIDPNKDKIIKRIILAELKIEAKFSFAIKIEIIIKGNINTIIPININKNNKKLIKEALKDSLNLENKSFLDFFKEEKIFSESKTRYLKEYSNIICINKEIIKIRRKEIVKNKLEFK
ncbi:hypothetical protein K9M42_01155 [Patescibacteria group bacterium]|nr:hypothetical protein [Patescibacteria group bacterium]